MCFICGRGNCCPQFHSHEEQAIFEPAREAFENYLEVREKCVAELEQQDNEPDRECQYCGEESCDCDML